MYRSVMVWPCRVGPIALVGWALVAVYGCGVGQEDCAELANCGPYDLPVIAGGETCNNGKDDDGDAAADCVDSDCANLVVCNTRNDGWTYGTLKIAPYDANAAFVKCPDDTNAELLYKGHQGHPGCGACTCGKDPMQSALECAGTPKLECTTMFMGDQTDWQPVETNDDFMCQKPADLGYMVHCRVKPVTVTPASCVPAGGQPIAAPAWTNNALSCPIALKDRVDEAEVCLRHDGDIPICPKGWNGTRTVVYKSESGSRACSPCACTGECTSEITIYNKDGCVIGGSPASLGVSTQATDVSILTGGEYSMQKEIPAAPLECTPSISTPIGTVEPEGPVTFCCK
jgi:hypothetical protein